MKGEAAAVGEAGAVASEEEGEIFSFDSLMLPPPPPIVVDDLYVDASSCRG